MWKGGSIYIALRGYRVRETFHLMVVKDLNYAREYFLPSLSNNYQHKVEYYICSFKITATSTG